MADEIDRITGVTSNVYTNFDKVARINEALNRYYFLASQASRQWNFDDHDNTSPPIENQNLVSGTGRYQFNSFTSEVLDLLRLEILNDAGVGVSLIPETMDDLDVPVFASQSGKFSFTAQDTFQERYLNTSNTGTPERYIKYGDFVYLSPIPNYSETNGLKAYFGRAPSKYTFVSCTISNASPAVITATGHGLTAGTAIIFETDGSIPTGITADTTVYYVKSTGLAADTFQISATAGTDGTAVNTSSAGSGNHTYVKVSKEPGIPAIHHIYLARWVALQFLIEKNLKQAELVSKLVQNDETAISRFFATRGKDLRPHLSPKIENNK